MPHAHPPNRRRTLMVCIFGGLALIALIRTEFHNRERFRETDYNHYYANSRLLRQGGNPWRLTHGAEAGQLTFNYPPAFYLLFSPFTFIAPQPGYWIWQVIQIGALVIAVLIGLREIRPPPPAELVVGAVALAFLFPQVYGSLYDSQPTALLLLMLVASWIADRHGRFAGAGALLAAAALIKIYPAIVGGYFLFRGRFKTVAWAAGCFTAGLILLIALYGWDRNLDFFRGTQASMIPFWLDMDRNISIVSNIHWLTLHLAGAGVAASRIPFAAAGVIQLGTVTIAGVITMRARDEAPDTQGICWGLWTIVAVLMSPLAWAHYLLLLIPFYFFVIARVFRYARETQLSGTLRLTLMLLAVGLAGFIVPYFATPVRSTHLYFVAIVLTLISGCFLVRSTESAGSLKKETARRY